MNEIIKCSPVRSWFRKKYIVTFKEHAATPEFNSVICQNSYQIHTYHTDYHVLIKSGAPSDDLLADYYRLL